MSDIFWAMKNDPLKLTDFSDVTAEGYGPTGKIFNRDNYESMEKLRKELHEKKLRKLEAGDQCYGLGGFNAARLDVLVKQKLREENLREQKLREEKLQKLVEGIKKLIVEAKIL